MLLSYEQSWKRVKRETGLSEKNAKAKLTGLPTVKDGARTKYFCTSLDAVIQEANRPPIVTDNERYISDKKRAKIEQYGLRNTV
jgi:hypothetical protein